MLFAPASDDSLPDYGDPVTERIEDRDLPHRFVTAAGVRLIASGIGCFAYRP